MNNKRKIIDERFFFSVGKHQKLNFEKQIGSTLEQGVSTNHLVFKQEILQDNFKRLASTLDLLVHVQIHIPKNTTLAISPITNITLSSLRQSFSDMDELIVNVENELKYKQELHDTYTESRTLSDKVPNTIREFLKDCATIIPVQYKDLTHMPLEQIQDNAEIQLLLAFWKWSLNKQ